MKIVVDSELLVEALEDASKAIASKNIMPILDCFLIEADSEGLKVTGTDTRTTIQSYVFSKDVQVEIDGRIALPKLALEMMKKLRGDVSIETKGTTVIIRSRKKEIDMGVFDPEEFPRVPDIDNSEMFETTGKEIKRLFKKTTYAADPTGKNVAILAGAHVYINEGVIGIEATDRHRLAKTEQNTDVGNLGGAVIEAKALGELQKIILDKDNLEFGFSKSSTGDVVHVFARTDRFTFYSRVLEGSFPDVSRMSIVPDGVTEITVEKDELMSCLDLIYTLAKEDKHNKIILSITEDEVSIRGQGKETGKANESIVPLSFKGEDFAVALNSKYFMEAIKALDGDKVTLVFSGKVKPIYILDESDEKSVHVVLPYRTEEV
ncbi:DNA polymerase III subunit beta [Paenibacillus sp. UMB7766-LJ446]|uniref:DNA polymerase III subunit beta n=1 Tax=Paenibacillus sp. UMB7766-LJ446 TaxID=3046313 RepID=UPI00254A51FF|nr:DNA polymerase III subunit beta [Paenibacillus sp. UMB7766-LJ446]MDK8188823.1 DNA polymerase III subunit beta [Paenibacillus sp. UMB7766-LJ446]